ncbi:MAG TPA: DUF202 domain-containing protein [bacterium]|nr:DUF202 domain-containing protein [bacterium]
MAKQDPRIYWAKERTFLAWVRTGLALMGFGFVVARFGLFLRLMRAQASDIPDPHSSASMWLGTLLVLMGVLVELGATLDYIRFCAKLKQGKTDPPSLSRLGVATAFGLVIFGLLMALYLIARG